MANTKKHAFLRGDASLEIGYGHIYRLLSIANIICTEYEIYFVCLTLPEELVNQIQFNDYKIKLIENEDEWIEKLTFEDTVIVDHYNINIKHHNQIKAKNAYLICIDDLHDKAFNSDVIINHGPGIRESDYEVVGKTKFALGLEYALLRAPFYEKSILQKQSNNIFICIGGTDLHNYSTSIVTKLLTNSRLTINLVTNKPELYEKNERLNIYTNLKANELRDLLDLCEFAVVSSSTISIEALYRDAYVIFGQTADNQKFLHEGLCDCANTFSIGFFDEKSPDIILTAIENKTTNGKKKILPTENKIYSLFK